MNQKRRAALKTVFDEIDALKSRLEDLAAEERKQFQNMSDTRQESEKGQAVDEAATYLESAVDDLVNCLESIDNATPADE